MIVDSTVYNGPCSCGREHWMVTRAAVIETGCLSRLGDILEEYGISGRRCAIYAANVYAALEGRRPRAEQEVVMEVEGLHADEKSTARALEQIAPDTELLLAVGSGTIHDITRYCAHARGIPFISVPTATSVDGFCSAVAALSR